MMLMNGLVGAVKSSLARWALWAFSAVVGLCVLAIVIRARTSFSAATERSVSQLVKAAAQWNSTSVQDSNVLLSLMHANYAMAYLNVARLLSTDNDIEAVAKVRMDELLTDFQEAQASAIQRLTTSCPAAMPPGLAAVHTGWITK